MIAATPATATTASAVVTLMRQSVTARLLARHGDTRSGEDAHYSVVVLGRNAAFAANYNIPLPGRAPMPATERLGDAPAKRDGDCLGLGAGENGPGGYRSAATGSATA